MAVADDDRDVLPLTVVIPVYERERSLPATVRSVEAQRGFRVTRIVVVDDASADGSVGVARALGCEVVELAVNGGAAAARNAGLALVQTPWVAFLDSDDEWHPDLLERLWPRTAEHVVVAGTAILRVGGIPISLVGTAQEPGRLLTSPAGVIDPENRIVPSATLVRTDAVRDLGGFDTSLRYSEDMDLWLRVLEHGTGWVDASVVLDYHRNPSSKSQHTKGVDVARAGIVRSYAGRPWCAPALVQRYLGGMYWDALRTALRGRDARGAAAATRALLRSPARLQGAWRCVARHRRLRARLQALLAAGQA
jgi:glycosyltransferase involved in cell wall biosynthesis